jgi:hypothetical protein
MSLITWIKRIPDRIRTFIVVDLKKFIWYVVTEPLRGLGKGFDSVKRNIEVIQRIQVWMFIFIALAIITLMVHRYTAAKAFAICFLMVVIHYEWKKGTFRQRWKEKEFKRIKIEMEKKKKMEDEKDEHSINNTLRDGRPSMDNGSGSDSSVGDLHNSQQGNKEQEGTKKE